jgi:hypothetical protein
MLLARHETIETLEIVDEGGRPVGSVTMPSDPRLFGAEKGTVYLARPLPCLPAAAPQSAHAA